MRKLKQVQLDKCGLFDCLIFYHPLVLKQENLLYRAGFLLYVSKINGFYKTFYLILLTIAVKASGWFIAKSAKTLRFNSMLLALIFPMN